MLSCDEQAELAAALCATAETLGQTMSASAAEIMAEDLAIYHGPAIAEALRSCRRECRGRLTLADILQRLQSTDGHPEPNEAWSVALSATDEADTVCMTNEIQLAMAASMPVFRAGDKVGARMAFISAYQRLVDTARREQKPVVWQLSIGHDQQRRVAAIDDAARLGRLPAKLATEYRAQLTHTPVTGDGMAIAGLLTGSSAKASVNVREKIAAIKTELAEKRKQRVEREQAEAAEAVEARKAEHDARVQAHMLSIEQLAGLGHE